MFEGSLVRIVGQPTSWCIGSFINWLKFGRLNPAMKGSKGASRTVPLDVTTWVEPEPTPGWVIAPIVGPDMVMIYGEGGSKLDEELEGPGEESVWGLGGL